MNTSRYDDETFFEKYGQMDRSRLGLAGAGEWETLETLLPDFSGRRVLTGSLEFERTLVW